MRKIELLCPASSLEVLKIAVIYGADAVYIGGEAFGLRAKAKNFSMEEMAEGVAFAHAHGVRVYVTANILAHNYDLDGVREYFTELHNMKPDRPDALIIADPAVFMIAKEVCPEIERHVSELLRNKIQKECTTHPRSLQGCMIHFFFFGTIYNFYPLRFEGISQIIFLLLFTHIKYFVTLYN